MFKGTQIKIILIFLIVSSLLVVSNAAAVKVSSLNLIELPAEAINENSFAQIIMRNSIKIMLIACYVGALVAIIEIIMLASGKDTNKAILEVINVVLGILPGMFAFMIPTILVIVKINSKSRKTKIIINIFLILFALLGIHVFGMLGTYSGSPILN